MAVVKITDVVKPELFTPYNSLDLLERNAFIKSGVAFSDPAVTKLMDAVQGGDVISLPFWNPITVSEPNVGDDSDTDSTPSGITASREIATKTFVNQSWGAKDIAGLLAGSSPMYDIAMKVDDFWTADGERRIIYAATGILAESVASHDSDLVYDISAQTGEGQTSTLGAASIITARGYLGEYMEDLTMIAMHPVVYTNLEQQNLIDFVRDADNNTLFKTYNGMRVIIDKNMPKVSLGGGIYKYYTYMFGNGVFSLNYGDPGIAQEIERNPASGNGQGEEILYSRRAILVHPRGYQVNVTTNTALAHGLTYANLALASTWTRAWTDRERIKFVAIATLG